MARLFYYSRDRALNEVAHALVREHGFTFVGKNPKTKLRAPNGRTFKISLTPSDGRASGKLRAWLRREFGITL